MKLPPLSYALAGVVVVGFGLYAWRKGGLGQALAGVGSGIVSAADSAVAGGVGAIGQGVGLPTPSQTTTDARVARYLIDNYGWLTASKWSSAGALFSAMGLDSGTGLPPDPNSDIARALPAVASYDETDRLLKRYPAPVSTTPVGWDDSNPLGPASWGLF